MSKHLGVGCSLFLIPSENARSALELEEGFSSAIPDLRHQGIGVLATVAGQHQADQAGNI